jgi:hypothetical protein
LSAVVILASGIATDMLTPSIRHSTIRPGQTRFNAAKVLAASPRARAGACRPATSPLSVVENAARWTLETLLETRALSPE